MTWIANPDGKRIFWLYGLAGSGKSTVANTISSRYKETKLLGASFRFNRDIEGRNRPGLLFRNLAHQLALFNSDYKVSLLQAVTKHGQMSSFVLRAQFEMFIIEPMNNISAVDPVVIVIDALDECGTEEERGELLETIAEASHKLPCFVKILLTSRDERDIRTVILLASSSLSINKVDNIADDIRTYAND
jgi:hypothetical protein